MPAAPSTPLPDIQTGIVLFELFHRLAQQLPDPGGGGGGDEGHAASPLEVLPLLATEIAKVRCAGGSSQVWGWGGRHRVWERCVGLPRRLQVRSPGCHSSMHSPARIAFLTPVSS